MSELFIQDRRKNNRDRRVHSRSATSGQISISFEDAIPYTIQATLVESSAGGFRAEHDSSALVPGLNVRYHRSGSAGNARVVWTHVQDGRRMSGFLLLP